MKSHYINVVGGAITCSDVKTELQTTIGSNSNFISFEVEAGASPQSVAANVFADEFYVALYGAIQIWTLSTLTLATTISITNGYITGININSDGSKLAIGIRDTSNVIQLDVATRTIDFTTGVGNIGGAACSTVAYSPDDAYIYWGWNGSSRFGRVNSTTGVNTLITSASNPLYPASANHNDCVTYGNSTYWLSNTTVVEFDHTVGTYGEITNTYTIATSNELITPLTSIWIDDDYEVIKTSKGQIVFFEKGSNFGTIESIESLGSVTRSDFTFGANIRRVNVGGNSGIDCYDTFIESGNGAWPSTTTYHCSTGAKFLLNINPI